MKTIYKYPIQLVQNQRLLLPVGSKILTCQMQNGLAQLWAVVDPEAPAGADAYDLIVMGTGGITDIDITTADYLGTVQEQNGVFVWHIFVRREQ